MALTVPGSRTLAATARELARRLDDGEASATSKSMCAKALADTVAQLRALVPAKQEPDAVDQLQARRQTRRARKAAP